LFAFEEGHEEFPLTLPVTVAGNVVGPTKGRLLVFTRGAWMPLRKWLLDLPDRRLLDPAEHCSEENRQLALSWQQRWWKVNGQVFPFMDLPTELRMQIYCHVLGPDIYPSTEDGTVVLCARWGSYFGRYVMNKTRNISFDNGFTGWLEAVNEPDP
jgi:hypothetical protein